MGELDQRGKHVRREAEQGIQISESKMCMTPLSGFN